MCFLWRNLCWVWNKRNTTSVFLLSNYSQELKIFYDWPVKYYFWHFGICLLGYRIEISFLYIPQGHYFISTLWLWSTDEYGFFLLSESPSLNKPFLVKTVISTSLFNDHLDQLAFTPWCLKIHQYFYYIHTLIICLSQVSIFRLLS